MAKSEVKTGFFIIADISGYTRFLAETEIEHAKGILDDLFGVVVPALRAPLSISGFQGDAVFAYAVESEVVSGQFMLDAAERVYGVFADQREKIRINTSCPCKACASVGDLDLKIIVHHGEFVTQHTNNREELAGRDVITAFRLLKNNVEKETGHRAYALITCDALEHMNLKDYFAPEAFMSEEIEHIGNVEFVVHPLIDAWRKQRDAKRFFIAEDDELAFPEQLATLPVGPDTAFHILTDPELRTEWFHVELVEISNDDNGRMGADTTMHCHHGGNEVTKLEIVDWRPGEYLTTHVALPLKGRFYITHELVALGEGTLIKTRVSRPVFESLPGRLLAGVITSKIRKQMGGEAMPKSMKTLEEIGKRIKAQSPQTAPGDPIAWHLERDRAMAQSAAG